MKKWIGIIGTICCVAIIVIIAVVNVNRGKQEEIIESNAGDYTVSEAGFDVEVVSSQANVVSENDISGNTVSGNTVSGNTVSGNTVSGNTVSGNTVSENNPITEIPEESEYINFAIADVNNYVNVRNKPSTEGDIVGKIYDGAVAEIVAVDGEQDDWFQIASGNVEGYVKAEFFIYGDAAAEVINEYVTRYVKVEVDRLNVRPEPSTEKTRIGYIDKGEKVKLLEDCGEWLRVQYTEEKEGYVSTEYVTVSEEYTYAKTLEEERAEEAAKRELEERQQEKEQSAPEVISDIEFPATTYTSNEELRKAIVDYAMQYLGNKYVSGGSSLEGGTDCSGFTSFIYADFGYSLSRTPEGQYTGNGRSIDYSQIQPGDIICYSTNGGKSCTHVAIYIGDGQIIHSANPRKGVVIGNADSDPIIGIKNVID